MNKLTGNGSQNPKCPNCGTFEYTAEIIYGMPLPELFELDGKFKDGRKFKLGGCCIEDDAPLWECEKCGHKWGKIVM